MINADEFRQASNWETAGFTPDHGHFPLFMGWKWKLQRSWAETLFLLLFEDLDSQRGRKLYKYLRGFRSCVISCEKHCVTELKFITKWTLEITASNYLTCHQILITAANFIDLCNQPRLNTTRFSFYFSRKAATAENFYVTFQPVIELRNCRIYYHRPSPFVKVSVKPKRQLFSVLLWWIEADRKKKTPLISALIMWK